MFYPQLHQPDAYFSQRTINVFDRSQDLIYDRDGLPAYRNGSRPQGLDDPLGRALLFAMCLCGFLGIAGVHRFFSGKIITGAIWLCTGGLFGIGTVVDLFLIGQGKFRDKQGILM